MRDIISVHVGQAGCQIGNACWELLCIEHGILPDGYLSDPYACDKFTETCQTFFEETRCGKYVPRTVLVDLEPNVVDEIRNNQYRDLFHPDRLITGLDDAASNFGRGRCTVGREISEYVYEQIRLCAEASDSLAGFFAFNSFGGGTGSGLSSLLYEQIEEDFSRHTKIEFGIYPTRRYSTAVVEPYNAILKSHATMDNVDCSFLMDNEALYNACKVNLDMDSPSFCDINRIIATIVSSIAAPFRFNGSSNMDLSGFQTNLVPYPRIHFPITSYAPLIKNSVREKSIYQITSVTRSVFEENNQMVTCDKSKGKYMACCMLYRGLIPPSDVIQGISHAKNNVDFVEWSPTGFKIDINFQPPAHIPGSFQARVPIGCCMLANTTAIVDSWARLDYKFDLMFAKRAFIHWYLGEGMEEDEFADARASMASLERDYQECALDSSFFETTEDGECSTPGTTTGRNTVSGRSMPITTTRRNTVFGCPIPITTTGKNTVAGCSMPITTTGKNTVSGCSMPITTTGKNTVSACSTPITTTRRNTVFGCSMPRTTTGRNTGYGCLIPRTTTERAL